MGFRTFYHVPFQFIERFLHIIIERRLNLEIYFNAEILDSTPPNIYETTARKLSDAGIETTIHSPFMDLSPGGIDKKIREVSLERMKQLMAAASYFNPASIVVHPGFDKWRFGGAEDKWLENSISTWQEVLNFLPRGRTIVCLENVFEEHPDPLIMLCKSLGNSKFKICFDTGHFNLFAKIAMDEWIEKIIGYIGEIHLHDNSGIDDEHNAIGSGTVNFRRLFELIKGREDIILTVEAHTSDNAVKSMERLKELLQ